MNNSLTTFTNPVTGSPIRVVDIDGDPWFVAADVCRALGFDMDGGTHRHTQALDADEKKIVAHVTGNFAGGPKRTAPTAAVISESGLYTLILRAHRSNPIAAAFQDWVTREVLPSIRKHGIYVAGQEKVQTGEVSDAEFIAIAVQRATKVIERSQAERDAALARDRGIPKL